MQELNNSKLHAKCECISICHDGLLYPQLFVVTYCPSKMSLGSITSSNFHPFSSSRSYSIAVSSFYTLVLYSRSVVSFCTLVLYSRSVLSFCTLGLYSRSVLSFYALVLCSRSILSFYTLVLYTRSILSFCTIVLYSRSILSFYTLVLYSRSILSFFTYARRDQLATTIINFECVLFIYPDLLSTSEMFTSLSSSPVQ